MVVRTQYTFLILYFCTFVFLIFAVFFRIIKKYFSFLFLFFSLAAVGHHTYPTTLFDNHFMRHPKNSVLADALKIKQSPHKGQKRNFKDADLEIEAESTYN